MKKEEVVRKYYLESVKGLNEIILNDRDIWYSYVVNLPIHLQVAYTVAILHQQVMNGGFHQYFFNSYGQFAFLTAESLKRIGAMQAAGILELALTEVNSDHLDELTFRDKIFYRKLMRITNFDENLFSYLDELDSKYYELNEDVIGLLADYLEKPSK